MGSKENAEVIDGQKVAHLRDGYLWKGPQGHKHEKSSSVSEAAEEKHIVLSI